MKELVENSLDAEATSIEVKLWNMGIKSFKVCDNGKGLRRKLRSYCFKAPYFETARVLRFNESNFFRISRRSFECPLRVSGKFSVSTKQEGEKVGSSLEFDRFGNLVSAKRTT